MIIILKLWKTKSPLLGNMPWSIKEYRGIMSQLTLKWFMKYICEIKKQMIVIEGSDWKLYRISLNFIVSVKLYHNYIKKKHTQFGTGLSKLSVNMLVARALWHMESWVTGRVKQEWRTIPSIIWGRGQIYSQSRGSKILICFRKSRERGIWPSLHVMVQHSGEWSQHRICRKMW